MSYLVQIVLAPPFNEKSGGIVVLHRLYKALKSVDQKSHLVLYKGMGDQFVVQTPDQRFIEPELLNEVFPNSIFIVPEVLCGSRLKNLRVARYYLNWLGAIAPATANIDEEFAIAFNPYFYPNFHFELPNFLGKIPIPESFESTRKMTRPINVTYFGKSAANYKENFPLPGSILVTRAWPESRDQYLEILGLSEYLFTFDFNSATNLDAQLLGVKVVILDFSPHNEQYYKKFSKNQPYLTAQNYDSGAAICNYIKIYDQWLSILRSERDNFEGNVRNLYQLLQKFFNG